jgi:hypothetical protein
MLLEGIVRFLVQSKVVEVQRIDRNRRLDFTNNETLLIDYPYYYALFSAMQEAVFIFLLL